MDLLRCSVRNNGVYGLFAAFRMYDEIYTVVNVRSDDVVLKDKLPDENSSIDGFLVVDFNSISETNPDVAYVNIRQFSIEEYGGRMGHGAFFRGIPVCMRDLKVGLDNISSVEF